MATLTISSSTEERRKLIEAILADLKVKGREWLLAELRYDPAAVSLIREEMHRLYFQLDLAEMEAEGLPDLRLTSTAVEESSFRSVALGRA